MSDGVTAMWDRIIEEEREARLTKFMKHSDNAKLRAVDAAINALDLFLESNPALTNQQWCHIKDAVAELKDLID